MRFSKFAGLSAQFLSERCEIVSINPITLYHAKPRAPHGKPVLLVHGAGAGAHYWTLWALRLLARGHPVFLADLRGHHSSGGVEGKRVGRVSIEEHLQDIQRIVDLIHKLTEQKVIVLGHSLGGLVGLKISEYNDSVHAVIALQSPAPRGVHTLMWSCGLLPDMARYALDMWWELPFMSSFRETEHLLFNRCTEPEGWHSKLVPSSGRTLREMVLGAVEIRPEYIGCPCLIVGGKHDRIIPSKLSLAVAHFLQVGGLPVDYLEIDAGHVPMIEPNSRDSFDRIMTWITVHH